MSHTCDVCDKTYTRVDSLNRHVNNKRHPQDGYRQCPECDDWYIDLGNHWNYNPEHRPELSPYQREVITGLLMSDATINSQEHTHPRFKCAMVTEEFITHLNEEVFPVLGTGVREIEPRENNVQVQYEMATTVHPELEEFREWYSTGEKVFPDGVELTPTVLRMWYVGDGHLYDHYSRTYPIISMLNEIDNKDKITSYFDDVGIDVSRFTWKDVVFSWDSTEAFFEHIRDPPPGFEHKWP